MDNFSLTSDWTLGPRSYLSWRVMSPDGGGVWGAGTPDDRYVLELSRFRDNSRESSRKTYLSTSSEFPVLLLMSRALRYLSVLTGWELPWIKTLETESAPVVNYDLTMS